MSKVIYLAGESGLRMGEALTAAAAAGLVPAEELRLVPLAGKDCSRLLHLVNDYLQTREVLRRSDRFLPNIRVTPARPEVCTPAPRGDLLTAAFPAETLAALCEAEALRQTLEDPALRPAEGETPAVFAAAGETQGYVLLRILPAVLGRNDLEAAVLLPDREPEGGDTDSVTAAAGTLLQSLTGYTRLVCAGLQEEDWQDVPAGKLTFSQLLAAWGFFLQRAGSGAVCWLSRGQLETDSLGHEGERLFTEVIAAMRTAAALSLELMPPLLARIRARNKGLSLSFNADHAFFRGVKADDDWWQETEEDLKQAERFFNAVAGLICEAFSTLPASILPKTELDARLAAAGSAYRRLLDTRAERRLVIDEAARLEEAEGPVVRRDRTQETESDRMQARLEQLEKELPDLQEDWQAEEKLLSAAERVRLLRRLRARLRRAAADEQRAAADRRELVARAMTYPEDQRNIDAINAKLAEAARLDSHVSLLFRTEELLRLDLQGAEAQLAQELSGSDALPDVPVNTILSVEALQRYSAFLTAGEDDSPRRKSLAQKAMADLCPGHPLPPLSQQVKKLSRSASGRTDDPLAALLNALIDLMHDEAAACTAREVNA